MSGPHVLLILGGSALIAMTTYFFVHYCQTGLMAGFKGMKARRSEQPIYFWLIVFFNIVYGILGTVMAVIGMAGLWTR